MSSGTMISLSAALAAGSHAFALCGAPRGVQDPARAGVGVFRSVPTWRQSLANPDAGLARPRGAGAQTARAPTRRCTKYRKKEAK